MRRLWPLALCALCACDDGGGEVAPPIDMGPPPDAALPDAAPQDQRRALVTHAFGTFELEPFEEVSGCVSWRLDNDAPIYIERIEFNSGGGFHHSNWFVVPEDTYDGPDGFFDCRDRGFDELEAAVTGTVIFAQSTQAIFEEQRLGDGVVQKVPPRHRVVAGVHLLNLGAAAMVSHLRMTLEVVHPEEVEVIVSPFRLNYLDLQIPALGASRFTADCDLAAAYERTTGEPFALELYWVLPHYHGLGDYFDVSIRGGPRDGESLLRLERFDAEPHGTAFDPPIDLADATGLTMTCGYDNPRPVEVGYGIGDQEMCVLLGFAKTQILMDASVTEETEMTGEALGVSHFAGPCRVISLPKNAAQGMPSPDELAAPLYVPPSDADPGEVAGPPACEDTPDDAVAGAPPTLENLQTHVFTPSCTYSACHGSARPAAGLDLTRADLRVALLDHQARSSQTMPLVAPGDPEGSLLFHRVSRCSPDGGVPHMPLNAPNLMEPARVALIRDWIAAGAP